MKKRLCITFILAAALVCLVVYSGRQGDKRRKIVYSQSLDLVAARINGEALTLRDLAFYVAYEENQVEQQALAYNCEDTSLYWNTRTDHTYIRIAARNAAIQMALHDELFYQMAQQEEIRLSEEEEELLAASVADFWADLTDDEKEIMLGVEYEDIAESMEKMAYAQKMQFIYSQLNNTEYETYDFSTDTYAAMLEEQDYKIYEDVWGRVDFGNVTLVH